MMRLDHIAIAAETLPEGASWVSDRLGVEVEPGGVHARMGTHNRLLSLGHTEYLEVIAIDPEAPPPVHPRWFALDSFAGPPRVTNWICACDKLETELLPGAGEPTDFARGNYRWRFAVPPSGALPFDGLQPAQIEWQGAAHPAAALPDRGCRLVGLTLIHPQAQDLARRLAGVLTDPRIRIEPGPAPLIAARIQTSSGVVHLGPEP